MDTEKEKKKGNKEKKENDNAKQSGLLMGKFNLKAYWFSRKVSRHQQQFLRLR